MAHDQQNAKPQSITLDGSRSQVDSDGSGLLDWEELRTVMTEIGYNLTEIQMEKALLEIDKVRRQISTF